MKRIKLFLDAEFTGLHKQTTLVSLALVSEFDDEFYAEFSDFSVQQVDGWIKENVIQNLLYNEASERTYNAVVRQPGRLHMVGLSRNVVSELLNFFRYTLERYPGYSGFEIWSDCLAYDWVLF